MPTPSRLARLLCRVCPRTMHAHAIQALNRGYRFAVTDCANELRDKGFPGLAEHLLDAMDELA